jgi:hypothetical protein
MNCGAPLAVDSGANPLACDYCNSWAAVSPRRVSEQERELARLDVEWEKEKAPYLTVFRDGRRRAVAPWAVVAGGMVLLLFLAFFDVGACVIAADQAASSEDALAVAWAPFLGLPLLGALFTFVSLCALRAELRKSLRYREAYRRYRGRREAIGARAE